MRVDSLARRYSSFTSWQAYAFN